MTTYKQLLIPDPGVACLPGYCLKYVQDTFDIPAREPSALADWNANTFNHPNEQPPAGMTVPVWFTGKSGALKDFGHVALHMGDGSVWSASHPTRHSPMHFGSIAELNNYYSGNLVYLGWSEDVEEVRVVAPTVTPKKEDPMTTAEKAKYNVGVAYSSLQKLGEGNIIFQATKDSSQWKLDSVVDQTPVSGGAFKKGDLFVCQYYANLMYHGKLTRYYLSEEDVLTGQLRGLNMGDVKIAKTYK